MRVQGAVAAVVFTMFCAAEIQAQVPPPPPPPMPPGPARDFAAQLQPQKTGTARLSGRVTALDTGRPIRRAVVRLGGAELREGKSVSTDTDGRWELRDLPAGRFSLMVTKGGYVSLSYGQQRPFETGKTIDVSDGQAIEKLDVALPRGSAITGRVVDEFGEPVTGARVLPLRYRSLQGRRRLTATGTSDTTDDLGTFRLHGLPPGDYYISAQVSAFTFLGTSEDRTGYAQTYYPGTLNAAEAQRVNLSLGQEAQNILIALTPTRVATLSGTAATSAGKPVAIGAVMLRSRHGTDAMGMIMPAMVRDGTWTMSGVAPGEYQLVLQYMPAFEQMAGGAPVGPTSGMIAEYAVQDLVITGEDVSGISFVTSPGGMARGRITFEGGTPPTSIPTGFSIQGFEPDADSALNMAGGPVRADWTFEVRGLFGRRLLRPMGMPPGWTLKAVTFGGQDITDIGVEATTGQEVSDIEVVLTQNAAELSGTVRDARSAAITEYVVLLFPPESEKWGWQSRYVKVARPDQTGRFVISGVPAGSYLAVALDYLESGEQSNPEFLERVRNLGTTLRIEEGEKKSVTLRLSVH